MRALPAGAYLALSHGTADFRQPGTASRAAIYESSRPAGTGIIGANGGQTTPRQDLAKIGMYAGVGIKKG